MDWCWELIAKRPSVETPQAVFERINAAAVALGFEYCAFGMRWPYPLSAPRIRMFSNYTPEWQQRYATSGYLLRDPSVDHGRRSSALRVWDERLFASAPAILAEGKSVGLQHGWFKSSLEVSGTGSMLTLARSTEPLGEKEIREKSERMAWLTQAAHEAFSAALSPEETPQGRAQLTCREIEVLRWTADGKSASEIADILSISDNTVNFHVKNAVLKLRVCNKTAATVRAAMLGLLTN